MSIRNDIMEIMAPVGSQESLSAALQAGADSVYFGVGGLNMRSRAAVNFTEADLPGIVDACKERGVRTYLTLNTVIYDGELAVMRRLADQARAAGISAVIASDIAVLEYCRSREMEVHISTQCNITNIEAVAFYARYADVMVTARELSLTQVAALHQAIRERNICGPSGRLVRLEVFAHGALCMAVSGKCYMSLDLFNQSANRGACFQPCRRAYLVRDREEGLELEIDHEYIMSPKDLCTIGFLDKIAQAGVTILKIEGRGRPADYVRVTTACYREAAQALAEGTYTRDKVDAWTGRLKTVYNRGFWDGYYLGQTLGEWSGKYGSQATQQKLYIGRVTNYYSRLGVAEIHVDTYDLSVGDDLMIIGPTTGAVPCRVNSLQVARSEVQKSVKGEDCSIALDALVRRGDKVYKLIPSEE